MKNPIYIEYRRSTLLGIILVLLLSALGAVVHYIRSLDDNVLQTKFRLSAVGNQLDSEFTPVLAFMEAVRRASLLKMSLPAVETDASLLLLQLSDLCVDFLERQIGAGHGRIGACGLNELISRCVI